MRVNLHYEKDNIIEKIKNDNKMLRELVADYEYELQRIEQKHIMLLYNLNDFIKRELDELN